jgi:CubicO group peptidase (beta-lactamase class C family)
MKTINCQKLIAAFLITLMTGAALHPQADPDARITDPVVLENFFDGLMTDHLRSNHVAGAVVAVVKDGKPVFSKGYGYADYAHKRPVSPDSTLFRIGSISKTFTWTAVMQLVQQGKLDLDEDVNIYLKDFKIPEGEGGPVTLRHLMTHTPGFEDRLIGLFAQDEKALKPYGEILKEQLPERVRPAGIEMSYSNHGTGIAAYIVEQVSGQTWDEYVERNIIQPLGMDHTTFRQPLPQHLSGLESKGYNYENGALKEYAFEFIPLSAVGGGSTTAADMARYMITHLQLGTYGTVAILDSTSASLMQAVAFRVSPYVSGIGLGIYELVNWNGIRTIGHGGDTFWFHCLMALVPEKNLGLFIAFNSQTGDYSQVFGLFMDHFYPLHPLKATLELSRENADKFTGVYRFNRFPHSDLTRITSIMSTVKMSYDTSGYLLSQERDVNKWFVVNDSTFIKESGDEYLVFGKQENGKYTKAFLGNLAVMPLERVPFMDSVALHILVLVIWILVFILTFMYWPVAYCIRRKYLLNEAERKALPASYKWPGWLSAFLVLFFIMGFAAALSKPWEIMYGVPTVLKGLLLIPVILCFWLILLLFQAYKLTRRKEYSLSGKVHFYTIVLALILLLWQLNHWNLLGFKY